MTIIVCIEQFVKEGLYENNYMVVASALVACSVYRLFVFGYGCYLFFKINPMIDARMPIIIYVSGLFMISFMIFLSGEQFLLLLFYPDLAMFGFVGFDCLFDSIYYFLCCASFILFCYISNFIKHVLFCSYYELWFFAWHGISFLVLDKY